MGVLDGQVTVSVALLLVVGTFVGVWVGSGLGV